MTMNKKSKVFVAGHRGLLGSAVERALQKRGFENLVLRSRSELDLMDQKATYQFFQAEKPEYVIDCAAKVGGIAANMKSLGSFLFENLVIQNNVIEGSRLSGVKKLLFVGSSCIYPREAKCPITEDQLLEGPLEPTNEGYAVAKIAGVRLCQFYKKQYGCDFISAIPTNLFGINDNYDPESSHLLPSLIRRVHEAKEKGETAVTIWGSGKPRREFMLSDDCADGLLFLMENYSDVDPVNVGTGKDLAVLELAECVARVLKAKVSFKLDSTRPDGMMRKDLDVSKLKVLGWSSKISLEEGIAVAYGDFLEKVSS